MKSTSVIAAFLLAASTILNAQTNKSLSYGLKAGMNNSHISGYEANGEKTGYIGTEIYGSFFLEMSIGKTTLFGTELLYSFTDDDQFIEIPLHVKQILSKKFTVFIGPKLDFFPEKLVVKNENMEFRTLGISADAGIQFNLLKRLFAEARYSVGLTKQINDVPFDILDGKRNTFRLGIGFRF